MTLGPACAHAASSARSSSASSCAWNAAAPNPSAMRVHAQASERDASRLEPSMLLLDIDQAQRRIREHDDDNLKPLANGGRHLATHINRPPSPVSATTGRSDRGARRRSPPAAQAHRRQAVRNQHVGRCANGPPHRGRKHVRAGVDGDPSRRARTARPLPRRHDPQRTGGVLRACSRCVATSCRTSCSSHVDSPTASASSPASRRCRRPAARQTVNWPSSITDRAHERIGAAYVQGLGINSTGSSPTPMIRSACSTIGRSMAPLVKIAAEPGMAVRHDAFRFVGDHAGMRRRSHKARIAAASAASRAPRPTSRSGRRACAIRSSIAGVGKRRFWVVRTYTRRRLPPARRRDNRDGPGRPAPSPRARAHQ